MKKGSISEKFLCEIWERHNFADGLTTIDGKPVVIITKGDKNKELGGPDYLNAKINIENTTYSGDIEIDTVIENWQYHKHHTNKKFNKVILHLVYDNISKQKFVTSENKREIPVIAISKFIPQYLKQSYTGLIKSGRIDDIFGLRCEKLNGELVGKFKDDYLLKLGSERFKIKSEKLLVRLKELAYLNQRELKEPIVNYDLQSVLNRVEFNINDFNDQLLWEQLLYESIFAALGYSKNKLNMTELAKSVEIKLLKQINNPTNMEQILEAILFNVSGLLPDVNKLFDEETSVYVRQLYELWMNYYNYDYGARLLPTSWNFFRMRPQNFPSVRIAGGAKILIKILNDNLIHHIIKLFEIENENYKLKQKLRNYFIVKAEGYWQNHFIFNETAKYKLRYLVGISRADEIIINVILPFLNLYFKIFNKKELVKKVLNFYLNFEQSGSNKTVENIISSLKIKSKRSVIFQGAIHLYKNYCYKNRCNNCLIGKEVF